MSPCRIKIPESEIHTVINCAFCGLYCKYSYDNSNIKFSLQCLDDFCASGPCCNFGSWKLILLFVIVTPLDQNPVQRVSLPIEKERFLFFQRLLFMAIKVGLKLGESATYIFDPPFIYHL